MQPQSQINFSLDNPQNQALADELAMLVDRESPNTTVAIRLLKHILAWHIQHDSSLFRWDDFIQMMLDVFDIFALKTSPDLSLIDEEEFISLSRKLYDKFMLISEATQFKRTLPLSTMFSDWCCYYFSQTFLETLNAPCKVLTSLIPQSVLLSCDSMQEISHEDSTGWMTLAFKRAANENYPTSCPTQYRMMRMSSRANANSHPYFFDKAEEMNWTMRVLVSDDEKAALSFIAQNTSDLSVLTSIQSIRKHSTALILCLRDGHESVQLALIDALTTDALQASIGIQDRDGWNTLITCFCYSPESVQLAMINKLQPDTLRAYLGVQERYGWNALMICFNKSSMLVQLKMIKILGPDALGSYIGSQNNDGWNALMSCLRYSPESVQLTVIEALDPDVLRASIGLQGKYDWTALMICFGYSPESVQLALIKRLGSDVLRACIGLKSKDDWTALMVCLIKSTQTVQNHLLNQLTPPQFQKDALVTNKWLETEYYKSAQFDKTISERIRVLKAFPCEHLTEPACNALWFPESQQNAKALVYWLAAGRELKKKYGVPTEIIIKVASFINTKASNKELIALKDYTERGVFLNAYSSLFWFKSRVKSFSDKLMSAESITDQINCIETALEKSSKTCLINKKNQLLALRP